MGQPLIFASLRPTAYEPAEQPHARSAGVYNIIVGHWMGLGTALFALCILNPWAAPNVLSTGIVIHTAALGHHHRGYSDNMVCVDSKRQATRSAREHFAGLAWNDANPAKCCSDFCRGADPYRYWRAAPAFQASIYGGANLESSRTDSLSWQENWRLRVQLDLRAALADN
jgi:hypothetical protein